jgi:hypothetical protein
MGAVLNYIGKLWKAVLLSIFVARVAVALYAHGLIANYTFNIHTPDLHQC